MAHPYKRLLLKLSGGAMAGADGSIFGAGAIDHTSARSWRCTRWASRSRW